MAHENCSVFFQGFRRILKLVGNRFKNLLISEIHEFVGNVKRCPLGTGSRTVTQGGIWASFCCTAEPAKMTKTPEIGKPRAAAARALNTDRLGVSEAFCGKLLTNPKKCRISQLLEMRICEKTPLLGLS